MLLKTEISQPVVFGASRILCKCHGCKVFALGHIQKAVGNNSIKPYGNSALYIGNNSVRYLVV